MYGRVAVEAAHLLSRDAALAPATYWEVAASKITASQTVHGTGATPQYLSRIPCIGPTDPTCAWGYGCESSH
jgi:hypothetical protein